MHSLDRAYRATQQNIARLTAAAARPPDSVLLLAVSKQHPAEKVAHLARLGHRHFGENYAQESREKIPQVAALLANENPKILPLRWHFIGHIQSRKCAFIAQNFDWVHTIARASDAEKLSQARQNLPTPLNILLQINLQRETSKSGITDPATQLQPLAEAVIALPHLRLRGLMTIPKPSPDPDAQAQIFRRCRQLNQKLRETLNATETKTKTNTETNTETETETTAPLDHLSMGMTADLPAAIQQGATIVRLGTAIFGARPEKTANKPTPPPSA